MNYRIIRFPAEPVGPIRIFRNYPPDKAVVYLGVQTQSDDVNAAQQENTKKMDRIIAAL